MKTLNIHSSSSEPVDAVDRLWLEGCLQHVQGGHIVKKIAVIGTHGVGKTTLCNALVDFLKKTDKRVELLEEVVRDCPYPIHEKQTYEAAEWIALNQVMREREKERSKIDYLICDRSAFDPLPYLGVFREKTAPYSMELHHSLWAYTRAYLKTYHKLVLVAPSDKIIESDGFRHTDKEIQLKVHMIFYDELEDMDIDAKWCDPSQGPYIFLIESEKIFTNIEQTCKHILE
jgi:predicted ATPase